MAFDLNIESFAYSLFHKLWYRYVSRILPDIREVYGVECSKVNDYVEVLGNLCTSIIGTRLNIFKNIYRADFTDETAESFKSLLDCYDYIVRTCDRDDLFGHLTVFQRMFATITFVLIVFLRMHQCKHSIDVVKYGHMFWVMYFDKFTEEFYEKGGWKELKRLAKSYEYLFKFDDEFGGCVFNIQKIRQATVNYFRFKNVVDSQQRKPKHPIHISKTWIKFHIEHFESYINIPLFYEIYINPLEVEGLLEDLKLVFVLSRRTSNDVEISAEKHQGNTISSAISYSELHYTSEEMKAKDTDVQPLTFQYESRIIDEVPDEFSNIYSSFENQTEEKLPISELEVLTLDITNKNENLGLDKNNLTEMELSKQTSSADSTKHFRIEPNILPVVNINKRPETSIKKSTNAVNSDHSCRSKSLENKCEDGTIEKFCNGNLEEQDKIAITDQVISINKMQEKTSPENVPVIKDFSPSNENISSDAKRKMTRKARKELRNEQKDPQIKNFLKMLLVLDDKEETKFVLSMLQNNEEGTENSQESSKKQNKK